ncbi:hypothetical protein ChUKH1_00990 [Cryptosporidium hominis]|uniref:Nuf2 DHR10-like domain-containing protein n=1 Tax=Cryptosporidium hominis TaxID=237895 RepID=A0ABX5BJ35_CRYHO|nr:hypothetical protein ChTU502y2012_377g0120 [Cryptosporidium hominis]PPA65705.1 hypothetical protein ChUKH1_00990 [Cryptosporidium hominis]PPS98138.1 Uncharacterized protein GY17_00000901 [Cryptosporidium hominis]|eukprot:PPS98138.1 Uncharacterized protein GY17_00000901 [Cryptosporidium hominis]
MVINEKGKKENNNEISPKHKLSDLCLLDLSRETSSLQLPNAFSKLMSISKQLQNELKLTRKERDDAYNSLILQRDYYEQSVGCPMNNDNGRNEILEKLLNNTANIEYRAELNNLKREYERKIYEMEKEFEEESKKLKTQILKDVEIYLAKYRDLAMLATEEAKRQQKKAELIKLKTRELTEITCKSFEEKLRSKMQEDLKKYEEATQSAYSKMILKEKSMNIKWNEREKFIEREKKDFEKSILKQAEKRIEEFRKGLMITHAQLNKEREIFEDMMGNLRERISSECAEFEKEMYHRFAVTFSLDENEVSRRMQNYNDALEKKGIN